MIPSRTNGGFNFKPLPQFQPEIFARVVPKDIGKRKAFDKGVVQLTDEGAIQLFRVDEYSSDYVFGAVGQLQFEVMQYRLKMNMGWIPLFNRSPILAALGLLEMKKHSKNFQFLSHKRQTGQAYCALFGKLGKAVRHETEPQS